MDLLDSYSSDDETPNDETKNDETKAKKRLGMEEKAIVNNGNNSLACDRLLFQPVSGDYPSLVYIEVPENSSLFSRLFDALASCNEIRSQSLAPLFTNNVHKLLQPIRRDVPLHISLSRVFTLRQNQISPFIKQITSALQNVANQKRLNLQLVSCPILFLNEVRTRGYFGLTLDSSSIELVDALVALVDVTMNAYGKPIHYKPSYHHVSFAVIEGNGDDLVNIVEANGIEAAKHFFFESQQEGGNSSASTVIRDEGKESVEKHLLSSSSLSLSSSLNTSFVSATTTRKRQRMEADLAPKNEISSPPLKGVIDKTSSSSTFTASGVTNERSEVLSDELSLILSDKALSTSWKAPHILVKIGNTTHKIPLV
jgi:hypothetical protein